MRLYHFTSRRRWQSIAADGEIRTTGNNLSRTYSRGPGVVWLTANPDEEPGAMWRTVDGDSKLGVRITVEVPDSEALWWPTWARRQRISESWYEALYETAKPSRPEDWYVVPRPIPRLEWVEAIEVRGGGQLPMP